MQEYQQRLSDASRNCVAEGLSYVRSGIQHAAKRRAGCTRHSTAIMLFFLTSHGRCVTWQCEVGRLRHSFGVPSRM